MALPRLITRGEKMTEYIKRGINFTPEQIKELTEVAKKELGVTFTAAVRVAVDSFLQNRKGV